MQSTESENSRLWNQIKVSDGNTITKPLQDHDKDLLIEEFLKIYEINIDNPEFIDLVNEMFEMLVERGYSKKMMLEHTKHWRHFSTKYGNDLSAFKRLKFTDVFDEKPFKLYNRKWFVEQEKILSGEKYEALQKMYKYVKIDIEAIYYSWHKLEKVPDGYVRWEDYNFKPKPELPEPKIELDQQLNDLALENFDLKAKLEKAVNKIKEKDSKIINLDTKIRILESRIIELESENGSLLESVELEATNAAI